MASIILGQPIASGPSIVVSGFPWSGQAKLPVGGVQLLWYVGLGSGNAYVYLSGGGVHPGSGGPTVFSGNILLSGGSKSGLMDGMLLLPNTSYFVPRIATGPSGQLNIFANCDAVASGVGRLFFEVFGWMLPVGMVGMSLLGGLSSYV